jgi:hypothetical protein
VAYTYADENGNYILSELPPGQYTITIDKLDVQKRNLSAEQLALQVNLPVTLDKPIDLTNIDFSLLASSF